MILIRQYKFYLFFSFLISGLFSAAQDTVSVRASIDKNRILIGERIHLTLEAKFPPNEPMRFFSFDSLPHFEILEKQKTDTVDQSGHIDLKQVIVLTSFDSGSWSLPMLPLPGSQIIFTDSLPVEVAFSPFDPNQDYHDIKDVVDVKPEEQKKKENWYWYAAVSAVIVAIMIYLLTRKKKKPVAAVGPPVDAYKEAMASLEKLRKEGESKLFFTGLIDAFRLYISRRTGITSLQQTSDDLLVQLKTLRLGSNEHNALAQALRMGDFVKFAKYEAGEDDKRNAFDTVKSVINIIEQKKIAEAKAEAQKKTN